MSMKDTKREIKNIQENIVKATSLIDMCKETLNQLNQDLNCLTLRTTVTKREKKQTTPPGNTSTKRTKKKKTPPPLREGELVISLTRPNKGKISKISGRTTCFLIMTPVNPEDKPFRKITLYLSALP